MFTVLEKHPVYNKHSIVEYENDISLSCVYFHSALACKNTYGAHEISLHIIRRLVQ